LVHFDDSVLLLAAKVVAAVVVTVALKAIDDSSIDCV
jgi:hypothetical protein